MMSSLNMSLGVGNSSESIFLELNASNSSHVPETVPWEELMKMDREINCRGDLSNSSVILFFVTGIFPAVLSAVFLVISILIYFFLKRYYTAVINEARQNLHEVMDNVMVSAIPMKLLADVSGLQFGKDGLDWRAKESSRRRRKKVVIKR